jgi:hypothetical protein
MPADGARPTLKWGRGITETVAGSSLTSPDHLIQETPGGTMIKHKTPYGRAGAAEEMVPTDPDPYTTIGGITEGSEAADDTTWTYGDEDDEGVKLGLHLYVQTRQAFFNASDHKWYAYVRLMTFSDSGLLYSVSAETRVEIEDPISHALLPPP